MIKVLLTVIFLLSSSTVVSQKIYKWKDENGTIHYSKEPREDSNENQQISLSKEKKGDAECCLLVEKAISAMLGRKIYSNEKKFEALFRSENFNVEELNNFVGSKAMYRGDRRDIPRLGFKKCMNSGFKFCRSTLPNITDSNNHIKSGSGFLVSMNGHIVTNEHVVENCKKIKIQPLNMDARVIAKDSNIDLALLKINSVESNFSKLRVSSPLLGEEIIVAGYPYKGLLSSGLKITSGVVSSLAGIQNNNKLIQITAPIQPGNSGGPLIDEYGNIVGVIVSKLDSEFMLRNFNDLPQNINFAIKVDVLKKFLYQNNVKYKEVVSKTKMELTEISRLAQGYTLDISCSN